MNLKLQMECFRQLFSFYEYKSFYNSFLYVIWRISKLTKDIIIMYFLFIPLISRFFLFLHVSLFESIKSPKSILSSFWKPSCFNKPVERVDKKFTPNKRIADPCVENKVLNFKALLS